MPDRTAVGESATPEATPASARGSRPPLATVPARPGLPGRLSILGLALLVAAISSAVLGTGAARGAAEPSPLPGSADCAMCHEPGGSRGKRVPDEAPPFDAGALRASPHAGLECISCHVDLAEVKEFPHGSRLARVECGTCHLAPQKQFDESIHGVALRKGERLAPTCKECHGRHDVKRPSDARAATHIVNVPALCGRCHHEGSPVHLKYNIPQDSILANYSESIHGEGLYKKGLTVTAVCTSCHTAHHVLPHTDSRSSIARGNVAGTCTQCHVRIEQVHRKIIRGELWEKQAHAIPACVDCHQPHKARRVFYTQGMSDRDCLSCHSRADIRRASDRKSLHVDATHLADSRHARIACAQCHTGVTASEVRPCRTVIPKVDCSVCHAEQADTYRGSTHGVLAATGSPDAPQCADCHGTHGVQGRLQTHSPTFSRNIPALCGNCHRTGQKAAARYRGEQTQIVEHYEESIHGKGLLESGLTVTATCVDCHTAHGERPHADPASSVHKANVAATCAQCHRGIYDLYRNSVHSTEHGDSTKSGKPLPTCSDCHSAHSIGRTDRENFRMNIMEQCGRCHAELTKTYFETYHGKVSKLGYLKTAKCYDCHGAHDILPVWDSRSHLSRQNIVKTCAQCHPGANRRFAGYLTHATHHDPKKYPGLFWSFWGMTALLIGTFAVAGVHTLAWLPRSLRYRRELRKSHALESPTHVRRFPKLYRNLHLMVIVSFISLAITGMTLKFSYAPWAAFLSRLLGGFEAAGVIHRVAAIVTFAYFGIHIADMLRRKRESGLSWLKFITGPSGMMFGPNDLKEFLQSFRWFLGRGPRPQYGRWTYWEKFDYFAVFWGVSVIGITGLLLWFPEVFTAVIPGWVLNVATVIHSDEALLAVGFIFTIHFFNTHFRPEKFPMDTVIFTGTVPLEEFKKDRPAEYAQLEASGELAARLEPAPDPRQVRKWRVFGWVALGLGIGLVLLIIYAAVFSYR